MTRPGNVVATRVALISNPGSGNNRRALDRVSARLAAWPQLAHHITRSPAEAEALVPRLAAEDVEVVAINGGDGTIAALVGMILHHWPADRLPLILVLPGGTANMTAGDVGLAASHRRAWRRFYRWLAQDCPLDGRVIERHIMRVEGARDGQRRYGMFLGTGAIMQATQYAHSAVHSRGLGGEISLGLILIRALWGLVRQDPRFYQPTRVRMRLQTGEDDPLERDEAPMLILVASTLGRLFLGIRPFWSTRPGALGLTAIQAGAARFSRSILSVLRGRPNRHATPENGYESLRADRAELWFDGELNLDGELFATAADRPLVVTAEGPVRFLRPR
ncbi:MAG: kinase [Chromatiales bacterium]|nr:kinase [Chromatiales bacterium]